MSLFRTIAAKTRLALYRALGGAAARLEPREDPAHMAQQFERGELVWRAFVDAGSALRRAGRFDQADAMVERGLAVYPDDRTLLYEHAFSAHAAGHYAIAVTRWEKALAAAPDLAMCHAGVAANLRETGDLERASAVIATALTRFPDDLTVVSEAARVAEIRMRFDESLGLWRRAAGTPNLPPEWAQGEAYALLRLHRLDEAQAVLARARAHHAGAPGLMAVDGLLALERGQWAKAVALWTDYRARFPDDRNGAEQLERALRGQANDRRSPPRSSRQDKNEAGLDAAGLNKADLTRLMLTFESLGDSGEFGQVQRHFGAEPESLLRWSDVALDGLIAALNERFVGLGEPANSHMVVATDGEWLVQDRRWGLTLHTFQHEGDGDRDRLFATACRGIVALRERLLADLTAAEKVFVFRSSGLQADRLEVLHHALRAYGPVRLLDIQPAAPTAPTLFQGAAGELMEVDTGRYVGFLERLGTRTSQGWDIIYDDWLAICRKAAAAR